MIENPYEMAQTVILALDPAKHQSGASILRPETGSPRPRLVTSAVVTDQAARETFVASAKEMAIALHLPLIIVAEEWDPPRGSGATRVDKRWNYKTILGMGEGWGKWTAEFERHALHELDIVRTTPNTWRDAIFGKKREKEGDKLKKIAVIYAQQRLKVELSHDAAESCCIGLWGFHSIDVHKRVAIWAKKHRKIP